MTPIEVTWDGSDVTVTISQSSNQTYEARDELAEFLTSRYPSFWPMQPDPVRGGLMSIDQRNKWRAVMADTYYANGLVLVARMAKGSGPLAVGITKPTGKPGQTELIVQSTGGYGNDKVDDAMKKALKAEAAKKGLKIGKERIEVIVHWDEVF